MFRSSCLDECDNGIRKLIWASMHKADDENYSFCIGKEKAISRFNEDQINKIRSLQRVIRAAKKDHYVNPQVDKLYQKTLDDYNDILNGWLRIYRRFLKILEPDIKIEAENIAMLKEMNQRNAKTAALLGK